MVSIEDIESVITAVINKKHTLIETKCTYGSRPSGGNTNDTVPNDNEFSLNSSQYYEYIFHTNVAGFEGNQYKGEFNKDLINLIAEDMCNKYGLEISSDSVVDLHNFSLWDSQHNTELRLGSFVTRPDLIDFTNNGNGVVDLDSFLRYYTGLPDMFKDNMGLVVFENSKRANHSSPLDFDYGSSNSVVLTRQCFEQSKVEGDAWNFQRIFYHECSHCVDYGKPSSKEAEVMGKIARGEKLSKRDISVLNSSKRFDKTFSSAKGNNYFRALMRNSVPFSSGYGFSYAMNTLGSGYDAPLSEDFADCMSMVAFRNQKDKSNAFIHVGGRTVDYDTFVREHKGTFDFCCDIVDGRISIKDGFISRN